MNRTLPLLLLLSACSQQPADITSGPTQVVGAQAIDGDTFILGESRYRLLGIDAPEMPGHCKGYRQAHSTCAPGNPFAAKAFLQYLLDDEVNCQASGRDVYHRILVSCTAADGTDVSQDLIVAGHAIPYQYHERS